jgi:hypothetical protein
MTLLSIPVHVTVCSQLSSYNLEHTFDVIVGDQSSPESKRFTLHTDVFVAQSGFLAAVRKPEWIAQDPEKPVDLQDEDPELFQAYMNITYFGSETIEQWVDALDLPAELQTFANDEQTALFTRLIRLYLLCEKLIDLKAANIVIDEIVRFSDMARVIPLLVPTSLAYGSTANGASLRKLLRDYWMYESSRVERQELRADGFPAECLQDIALAALERLDGLPLERADINMSVRTLCLREKYRYHLHDRLHPQCGVKEERDGM